MDVIATRFTRLLLVEDDWADARLLGEHLRGMGERFEMRHAATLADAVDLLGRETFDVVLLDLNLPDARGLEAVHVVREWAEDVPVVVVSGAEDGALAEEALRRGCQDYLIKSNVSPDMLRRVLRYATSRAAAARLLRDSEERFRDFAEASGDWFWEMDADLRFSAFSEGLERIAGSGLGGYVGRRRTDLMTDPTTPEARQHLEDLDNHRPFRDFEYTGRLPDGSRRIFSISGKPLFRGGRFVGYRGIGRDVTDRKATEVQALVLSEAVRQSPVTVMVTDLDGRIEYVNDAFTRNTGFSLDDVRGRTPHLLRSGHTSADEYKVMWSTLRAGDTWRGVFLNRRRDGTTFWEQAVISPVRDGAGRAIRYLAVKEDITERRAAEQAQAETLETQKAFNRLLAISLESGRLENKLERCLAALLETPWLSLLPRAGVLLADGRKTLRLAAAHDFPAEAAERCGVVELGACLCGTAAATGRTQCVPPVDSGPVWCTQGLEADSGSYAVPIQSGGMLLGVLVLFMRADARDAGRDEAFLQSVAKLLATLIIREKVLNELREAKQRADRAAERMAASERKLRGLFEGTSIAIYIHRHFKPLYANASALRMVGVADLATFLGASSTAVFLSDDDAVRARGYHEARLRGEPAPDEYEMSVRCSDGSTIPVLNRSFPIEWDGEIAVCTTLVDLTRRKEAEAAILAAKAEAEAANRAKSEFLSRMSHELRTPMNAILGFAELMETSRKDPVSDRQRGYLSHIRKGGAHLLSLINDVLDLARIEAGHIGLSIDAVDTRALVDDCLTTTRTLAAPRGVTVIDATGGMGLPWITADLTRARQVLLNLLSNAVKYNRPQGTLTLTARPGEGRLRLEVADTGWGIPQARQGELFQPFSRLGQEGGEIEGTGIGLTITRRLVEEMGGAIGFSSVEGQGSVFWIDLPLAGGDASGVVEAADEPAAATCAQADEGADAWRVLYVEDNPANLALMEEIIDDIGGHVLTSAHTAEIGIEMARAAPPDIILMDINLPGMDGFAALEVLRRDTRTSGIPVIALSADAMPATVRRGEQAGFAAYLTKPVRVDTLLAELGRAIDGRRGRST
ncbi:PAS domain S-box protein [Novispirillum sp. DQ9]|uniref:PAS domain S-box protein n=1 Tax=Novispirillum sp. DQ9 TaxID=3398612 RepID=UPI003C7E4953